VLRPQRFETEVDPGPIQIQARKVHFDVADVPLHWIPRHPVASNMISLLNIVLPSAERWFVATYNEALPLGKDPKLAEDMRGFIGQEATHADVHDKVLHEFMFTHGVDPTPILDQIEYAFEKILSPSDSSDPKTRLNNLCDRLWLIAAIEHYTAVLGDFSLNCAWDDYGADPTMVDTFFQRGVSYLSKNDPEARLTWWRTQRLRMRDSKLDLLPKYRKLFGSNTLMYFKPSFSPEEMGSTAQAVAYLAISPAARTAHL